MKIANTFLNKEPNFLDATDQVDVLKDPNCVDLFDQNGYHLTKAEQAFLVRNGYAPIERRHEDCLRQDWLIWDKRDGAHINHSDIFERKGFADQALEQIEYIASESNPMLFKLVKMKPKISAETKQPSSCSLFFASPKKLFMFFVLFTKLFSSLKTIY